MNRLQTLKTNFTAGELSPDLLGRGDLRAYENGALRLRNVMVQPTGGVTRRPGLAYVATALGSGRLVTFEFNTEQTYLLVFTDLYLEVFADGLYQTGFATPWTEAQVAQINWTQSADTLLVVHPDVAPRKITRTSHTAWTIAEWEFFEKDGVIYQPMHKFAAEAVTVTPSATTGAITVTASADAFQSDHVGTRLRIGGKEIEVTGYSSATQVSANVKQDLANTTATKDWEEQAFSALRGWPVSVCFHQDRMVIGGARDLPNRLWMSKSSDLFNFDLGEGLDDESIDFAILSDSVNAVRHVFSGRHLQVFTSGAEWMVTGDPLTPANIQLRRQTRIGSSLARTVPPRDVDGATLFASRNGLDIREYLFADVEQAYQARDLAMLSKHLVNAPIDMDYEAPGRLFHIVMGDGTLATVTNYRAEEVTAWSLHETDGAFRSVAVVGDDVYVLVERQGAILIERFDPGTLMDSALTGSDAEGKSVWSGLDHLEGRNVQVLADGGERADLMVSGGAITLADPATDIVVGLPYAHEIAPLPPFPQGPMTGGSGQMARLIQVIFRVKETAALTVDTGRGAKPVPFRKFGEDGVFDAPPPRFTGDVALRAIGWHRDAVAPLWRVTGDAPLPCMILSVITDMKVSD